MEISKEFIQGEIADIKREMGNAQNFLVRAQAAIDVHEMLLKKLDEPQPTEKEQS